MILNGLGDDLYTQQHALNSARLVNESQPSYLAALVLSFALGEEHFLKYFPADFHLLDQPGLFKEMQQFIEHAELNCTIFRSGQASNYLVLKDVMGRDKQCLLDKLKLAIDSPNELALRQEWQWGL